MGFIIPTNEYIRMMDYKAWESGDEEVPWIDKIWMLLDQEDEKDDAFYKQYQVNLEPRVMGEWELLRSDIPRRSYERLHHILSNNTIDLNRDTGWGPITVLKKNGEVWMSDTKAEILEHAPFLNRLWWLQELSPRVLINGLGLGMAVKAALHHNAEHVDVVEIDADVIEMVGSAFADEPRVTIHHADALEKKWPHHSRWAVAWHDIWPTISEDNLDDMERLRVKYRHRASWQASWQRKGCLAQRRKTKQFAKALEAQDWDKVRQLDPNF